MSAGACVWAWLLRLSLAGIDDREYNRDVGRDLPGGAGVTAPLELHQADAFGVVRDGVRLADGDLRSRKARSRLRIMPRS